MNATVRSIFACCALYVSISTPRLFAEEKWSRRELNRRVRDASTTEQHRELASYFSEQEIAFRARAQDMQNRIDRYMELSMPERYPHRVDVAHQLLSYYRSRAEAMAKLSRYHAALAQAVPAAAVGK